MTNQGRMEFVVFVWCQEGSGCLFLIALFSWLLGSLFGLLGWQLPMKRGQDDSSNALTTCSRMSGQ